MAPGQLLCKSPRAACAPIPDTISYKVLRLESDLLAAPPDDLQARTRSKQEMVLGQLQSPRSLSMKLGCVQICDDCQKPTYQNLFRDSEELEAFCLRYC